MTTGIATFGECILIFLAANIYLDLEYALSMPGLATFFGAICAVG